MSRAFRLAGLLRLRNLEEEQAAARLATANAAVRETEERREDLMVMVGAAGFPSHADESAWLSVVASRASLAGLVTEARTAQDVAARRSELATEDWSAARTRLAMVDKLAARHAAHVRAEDEKAEQLVLDEAAARRHAVLGIEEER